MERGMVIYWALSSAIAVLILSIGLAVANKRYKVVDKTTFIALLLIPLVVLGVASGTIQEFSAPGGLGAKFREVARADVSPLKLAQLQLDEQAVESIAKGDTTTLRKRAEKLVIGQPVLLTLTLGTPFYQVPAIAESINIFLEIDRDMLVAILDQAGKFVAMADGARLLTFFKEEGTGSDGKSAGKNLVDAIRNGFPPPHLKELLVFETLKEGQTSNAQALQKMLQYNVRAMTVVNSDDKPDHIAKRDQIVARLVAQLAASER
jgi:hypothetical protein